MKHQTRVVAFILHLEDKRQIMLNNLETQQKQKTCIRFGSL